MKLAMQDSELGEHVTSVLRNSESKGALLERATEALLGEMGFTNIHRQLSGTQFGYDISAELLNSEGKKELWKFECKNLARPLTISDLAPKLIWHIAPSTIDVFVVISLSPLSNDLTFLLGNHSYSFPIAVWSSATLISLLCSSSAALKALSITDIPTAFDATAFPKPYLPLGPLSLDVVHKQNPPRELAYFRLDGMIKAYTACEFKLQMLFTNKASEEVIVHTLKCKTMRYLPLEQCRVLCQVKMKGIIQPEKMVYQPSTVPSGEVSVFEEVVLKVKSNTLEIICAELSTGCRPGYYELEFIAEASTVQGTQRVSSPIFPLFIQGENHDVAHLQVIGKHYDEPASAILNLDSDNWKILTAKKRDKILWLGPTIPEITVRNQSYSQWNIRSQPLTLHAESSAIPEGDPQTEIDLQVKVTEELFSVKMASDRGSGNWAPSQWLSEQMNRRRRVVTREK